MKGYAKIRNESKPPKTSQIIAILSQIRVKPPKLWRNHQKRAKLWRNHPTQIMSKPPKPAKLDRNHLVWVVLGGSISTLVK